MFKTFYFRKKKINPSDKDSRVDEVDQNGDSWQIYPVISGGFREWLTINYPEVDLDKISEKEIDGKKVLKVEVIFFDDMRYETCRDTNYTVLDGWLWDEEEMDKEIVKQLIDRKKIND